MDFQHLIDSIQNGTVPQLSLGSAALVIFLVCVVLVFVRGFFRILIGSATIAVSVYIGLWAWRESGAIGIRYTGQSLPWLSIAWPVVAGLLTFVILRLITNFVMKPFGNSDGPGPSFLSRLIRIPFALVPAAILCVTGILLVRHTGDLAELRSYADRTASAKRPEWTKLAEDLKKTVDANIPSDWLARIDPTADKLRLKLAKLITAKAGNEVPPKAIPVLEQPVLKAIIVDEARLKALARDKRYGTLLNHPDLDKALRDPRVQEALRNADL